MAHTILSLTGQLLFLLQMGFHLCLVGWLNNGTAGYPTVYPTPSCGSNHIGIVDYGSRKNLTERWDAFCYRAKGMERLSIGSVGICSRECDYTRLYLKGVLYQEFMLLLIMHTPQRQGENLPNTSAIHCLSVNATLAGFHYTGLCPEHSYFLIT